MLDPDFDPFVSGQREREWCAPPFDVPEQMRTLEAWKKMPGKILFGETKEGRKWHRDAGLRFLKDFEAMSMTWVTDKLGRRNALGSSAALLALGEITPSSGSPSARADDGQVVMTVRSMFANDPHGTAEDGLDPSGKALLRMHRTTYDQTLRHPPAIS